MKKIIIIFLIIISIFLLTGCNNIRYKYHSNYTENEIFELVNSYISEYTYESPNYNLKIIKKEPLKVCTFGWNVCHKYTTIKGANKYTVELTNKTTSRKESQVVVSDKYYENGITITPHVYSPNFIGNREYYERYDKLVSLLNNYSSIKYNLIDDQTKTDQTKIVQYGYIYSSNISDLENFLNSIIKRQYEYYWNFIITNNINEYNELSKNMDSFDKILMQYEKTNTVYQVDLSSFNNNPYAVIENTSQGSSTCVNSVLIKK